MLTPSLPQAMPHILALSRGEGDAAAVRRYQRKQELQLLAKTVTEIKALSAYQLSNMSTSGLERHELGCLIHTLSADTAPKQAAAFLSILREKFAKLPKPAQIAAPPPPPPLPPPVAPPRWRPSWAP